MTIHTGKNSSSSSNNNHNHNSSSSSNSECEKESTSSSTSDLKRRIQGDSSALATILTPAIKNQSSKVKDRRDSKTTTTAIVSFSSSVSSDRFKEKRDNQAFIKTNYTTTNNNNTVKMMDISSTPSPPHHLVSPSTPSGTTGATTSLSSNGLVAQFLDSFINNSNNSSPSSGVPLSPQTPTPTADDVPLSRFARLDNNGHQKELCSSINGVAKMCSELDKSGDERQRKNVSNEIDFQMSLMVDQTSLTFSDESPKSLKASGSISVTPTFGSGADEEEDEGNVRENVSPTSSTTTTGSGNYSAPVEGTNGLNCSLSSSRPHPHHSKHHRHGIKAGKGATLKRVSFGSSKGSMVETLIYDHNEDDGSGGGGGVGIGDSNSVPNGSLLQKRFLFSSCPDTDGKRYLGLSSTSSGTPSSHSHHHHSSHNHHLQHQQQPHHYPAPHLLPHHFHYPSSNSWATPASSVTSRRLLGGDRAESESTISGSSERPTKFRVSLYDFEKPNLLTTTPDSPPENNGSYFRSTNGASNPINRSPPSTTATIRSLTLSTAIDQSRGAHLEMDRRKESTDSGVDNPFRPGGELSREAETIVNLIKEGKPITPTTPTKDLTDSSRTLTPNGNNNSSISSSNNGSLKVETSKSPTGNGVNGSTPKSPTGVVEVQRTTIVPTKESPSQAEPVVLKKKPKCKCCVIQ